MPNDRLTINECQAARYLNADGYPLRIIGSLLDHRPATLAPHVRGDCDCPTPDGPVEYDPLEGAALRERRREAGYSITGFAEAVGVSRAAVQQWERGDNTPRPQNVLAILDVLGGEGDE